MPADLARQRQEPERLGEIDVVGGKPLRKPLAFRFLAVDGLAKLHIGPEAAGAQGDFEAGLRVLAELLHAAVRRPVGARRKLAGVGAFRIVRAPDEAAELAELEREPSLATERAQPRIRAVGARRKEMWPEHLVERIDHLGDPQFL